MCEFHVLATTGAARTGVLTTPHGSVQTPVFIPVGTRGTVKAMTPEELSELGAELILANTFHLYLRPGADVIRDLGGLHTFMNWHKPLLTDSGGFQIFSLAPLRKISEDGATFRSPIDGSMHAFTPERSIEVQNALGADIIMALDECTPYPCTFDDAQRSMELTLRWAARCKRAHQNANQALFGIVQGSVYADVRVRSARETVALDFPGYAIGGVSVGESKKEMIQVLDATLPLLPADKPRYLMGVGTPEDFVAAIDRGVDMFDCVIPTRNARNGKLYTREGALSIKRAEFARDERPVSERCGCYTCRHYSRAYLRHLYLSREILSARLNTLHNLFFFFDLFREIRTAITSGTWEMFKSEMAHIPFDTSEEP